MFVEHGGVAESEAAIEQIAAGFDRLLAADLSGIGADDAARVIARLERQTRRGEAMECRVLDAVERSGAHLADGHVSAKVMVRHHAHLSNPEAVRRERVARMLRELPAFTEVYGAGLVSTDHIRRLSLVWANRRVRDQVAVCEEWFLDAARTLEYPEFHELCQEWEHRVDQDGAAPSERRWRRRDVKAVQDFNGLWDLRGRMMSLDGAEFAEILRRLSDAERLADIEAAKAEHGDEWRDHLPRTIPQLRYDAFMKLIRRGAGSAPGTTEGRIDVDVVIDDTTFEAGLRQLVGAEPEPIDPIEALDHNRFSRTSDGVFVRPEEIVARALVLHVRRVVINSAGVVIDMGRRTTLFTGSAREAALLQAISCYWKACWIPASSCEVDHLEPRREGGRTNPGNGAPGCGHHNRWKEKGYHAWRDPNGQWHITRPDGTPVPDHLAHWPDPRDEGLDEAA